MNADDDDIDPTPNDREHVLLAYNSEYAAMEAVVESVRWMQKSKQKVYAKVRAALDGLDAVRARRGSRE